MNRIHILNTNIDNYSMSETMEAIRSAIRERRQIQHVVVNAGKMVAMQKDLELRRSVNQSDLINADGQSVVWASRVLGKPLKERVAGIDIMENLVEMANRNGYSIYFFGAREEVVAEVVQKYTERYGNDILAGYRNGYFREEEEADIAREIAGSGAQILFVAISSPTKENFLFRYKEVLKDINFIMGVGGSFDVVSGLVRRAPEWMQNAGLEWFYRFLQEPRRMWKRYLVGNSVFIYLVLKAYFSRTKDAQS